MKKILVTPPFVVGGLEDSPDGAQVGRMPGGVGGPVRDGVGNEGDGAAPSGRARLDVETEVTDHDRFIRCSTERLHQVVDPVGAWFRPEVFAGDNRVEHEAMPARSALNTSAAVAREDGYLDAACTEPIDQFLRPRRKAASRGGLGLVALEDPIGPRKFGLAHRGHAFEDGRGLLQADLGPNRIEVERRLQECPVEVEDDKFQDHGMGNHGRARAEGQQ